MSAEHAALGGTPLGVWLGVASCKDCGTFPADPCDGDEYTAPCGHRWGYRSMSEPEDAKDAEIARLSQQLARYERAFGRLNANSEPGAAGTAPALAEPCKEGST